MDARVHVIDKAKWCLKLEPVTCWLGFIDVLKIVVVKGFSAM